MAEKSKIEWTDATWNPITGCSVVSPGCTNCYAMKLAGTRLQHHPSRKGLTIDSNAGPVWNGEVRFNEQWLDQPLRWKRPRMIFVCAHGDLFHESVPDEWIHKVFAVMALAPQHTFQVLTKRPERMRDYLTGKHPNPQGWPKESYDAATCIRLSMGGLLGGKRLPNGCRDTLDFLKSDRPARYGDANRRLHSDWPLPNVWLGVSVEDQARADERIPILLETPAALRWISAEPLLGPIDLTYQCNGHYFFNSLRGKRWHDAPEDAPHYSCFPPVGAPMKTGTPASHIEWVVSGDESGPNRRPCEEDWHRSLQKQCADAGVPFHLKQRLIDGRKVGNPPLDGVIHDTFPQVPT